MCIRDRLPPADTPDPPSVTEADTPVTLTFGFCIALTLAVPRAAVSDTPVTATVTSLIPCEEKGASANEEAAKVIRVYPTPLLYLL